jgi:sec-independent protein translocase protein TatC
MNNMVLTFHGHWRELWIRLVAVLSSWCVMAFICFRYRSWIWSSLVGLHSPKGMVTDELHFISTDVGEAFISYVTLSFYLGGLFVRPLRCYHVWAYVRPGFTKTETEIFGKTMILWVRTIYVSHCFSLFVMGPAVYEFLLTFTSSEFQAPEFLGKMDSFLSFLLSLWIWNALRFVRPLGFYWVIRLEYVSMDQLGSAFARKVFLLVSLCVGALRSPPDITSQLFIALPLVLGYELALFCGCYHKAYNKTKENKESKESKESK